LQADVAEQLISISVPNIIVQKSQRRETGFRRSNVG